MCLFATLRYSTKKIRIFGLFENIQYGLPIDESLAEQGTCNLTPKAMLLSIFINRSEKYTVYNFFAALGAGDAQALQQRRLGCAQRYPTMQITVISNTNGFWSPDPHFRSVANGEAVSTCWVSFLNPTYDAINRLFCDNRNLARIQYQILSSNSSPVCIQAYCFALKLNFWPPMAASYINPPLAWVKTAIPL